MKRRVDWPERMADALESARSKAFSEQYCCAAFAADVVLSMTGEDPLPQRDESVAQSYARMRAEGFKTIEDALAARVGPLVPLAFARRGDVILRRDEAGNEAIGICCGADSAFINSDGGLAFWPTLDQAAAFRLP